MILSSSFYIEDHLISLSLSLSLSLPPSLSLSFSLPPFLSPSPSCPSAFVLSDDGLAWLSQTFQLCQPLKSASELTDWLQETWFNMAMGECVCQHGRHGVAWSILVVYGKRSEHLVRAISLSHLTHARVTMQWTTPSQLTF